MEDKFLNLVATELEIDRSKLDLTTKLDESIDWDSLSAISLISALDDQFDTQIDDDDLNTVKEKVSNINIYVSFPGVKDIPLFIIFRAFGYESDKIIYDFILRDLLIYINKPKIVKVKNCLIYGADAKGLQLSKYLESDLQSGVVAGYKLLC